MKPNRLVLTTRLRKPSLVQQRRHDGDGAAAANAAVTFISLARMRKRCRTLNDAYEAAENKHEVRVSIQETVRHLRDLHAMLPARFRNKSWITTIEHYDSWSLDARKTA